MIYLTADLHLGHAGIIDFCGRPFESVDEMNRVLIENINGRVKQADKLYILGDLAYWKGDDRFINLVRWRAQIRCETVLAVPGNHCFFFPDRITELPPIFELKVDGKHTIVCCHYAMRTWNKSHRGSYHAYGHSHGTLPENDSLSMDVGVDAVAKRLAGDGPLLPNHYQPISVTEFLQAMDAKAVLNSLNYSKGL